MACGSKVLPIFLLFFIFALVERKNEE